MRKILYFIMLSCSLLTLCLFGLAPIYNFSDNNIYSKPNDLGALITESDIRMHMSELSDSEKERYKENFLKINMLVYAYTNNDDILLYQYGKVTVLNAIYKKQFGAEGKLSSDSVEEAIQNMEDILIDAMGEETFTEEKENQLKILRQNFRTTLYDMYEDDVKDLLASSSDELSAKKIFSTLGAYNISSGFLLSYFNKTDDEAKVTFRQIMKKGIFAKDFVQTVKNAWDIDKYVWEKEECKSFDFIAHVKAVATDSEFYNFFPLLGLLIIYIALILSLISLTFKAIKGLIGKKYPHSFIHSIVFSAICIGLVYGINRIPVTYLCSYHYISYSYLLDYFTYGNQGIAIYAATFTFIVSILISILGRMCKWEK